MKTEKKKNRWLNIRVRESDANKIMEETLALVNPIARISWPCYKRGYKRFIRQDKKKKKLTVRTIMPLLAFTFVTFQGKFYIKSLQYHYMIV